MDTSRTGPGTIGGAATTLFRRVVHACTLRGFSLRTRVATACVVVILAVVGSGVLVGGTLGVAVSNVVRKAMASEPLLETHPGSTR